jgi:hypothetical protein
MTSALFATASVKDIRIWNANDSTLLLKISVPNVECKCIVFKKDGTSLITGTLLIFLIYSKRLDGWED